MSNHLQGLRTVIYPTPDIEAAKEWWVDFLGFPPYFDESFYVGFDVGGYELGLLPDGDPSVGALTYWGVEDVAGAIEASTLRHATLREPPHDIGDGIIVGAVMTPQGNFLGFIFNPHFVARN